MPVPAGILRVCNYRRNECATSSPLSSTHPHTVSCALSRKAPGPISTKSQNLRPYSLAGAPRIAEKAKSQDGEARTCE